MGAGINLFRQLFPEDYYAYQTATLISSKPVAKKVVGINRWDEEWELSGSNVKSKNPIKVFPNTTYFMCCPVTADIDIVTSTGTYVSYLTSKSNGTFTTPNNCEYIHFTMRANYGTTYNHDISINLPSTDHDYHAYEEHTYPLGGDELRGLLKVENGQLVAYGDIHPSDGNGTEVFDIVDLSTLTWTDWGNGSYGTELNNAKMLTGYYDISNAIAEKYFNSSWGVVVDEKTPLTMVLRVVDGTKYLVIVSGVGVTPTGNLIYEKATPTAKSYTPFTNPMLCGSTEEFTDSRSVKMPTGYQALYYTSPFKNW